MHRRPARLHRRPVRSHRTPRPPAPTKSQVAPTTVSANLKDSFLAEIRAGKGFFYNTVVAQAQRIDVGDDRISFTFLPAHRALRDQFEQNRPWLEAAVQRLAGRAIPVVAAMAPAADPVPESSGAAHPRKEASASGARDLKAEALSSSAVQAMLDVFPAEIRDVEEM